MGRRKPVYESHVRLMRHEHESPAYQSLCVEARALLVEFRALYHGGENRVYMSVREIRRRLKGISQRRAERARDELLDRGFIRLLTQGKFTRKARHATEYALTNEPLNKNSLAPKDFMRWRPQKNSVLTVNTLGTHSEYREDDSASKKQPLGTHSEYREGSNQPALGTHCEYTDKLPTGGRTDWLAEHGGWPCSKKFMQGAILDTCCIVCGVWTTSGRIEFDGVKHSCDAVSKAKYQERLQASKQKLAEAA